LKIGGFKEDSVSFARIVDDKLKSIEPELTLSTRTKALLADIRQLRFQGLVESKELEEYKTEFERTRDGLNCFLDDPTVISSQKKRGKASMQLARFCDAEIQRGALSQVCPSLLALAVGTRFVPCTNLLSHLESRQFCLILICLLNYTQNSLEECKTMFVEQLTSAMQCGIPEAQVPDGPRFIVSGTLRACQRERYHLLR
jgi:hypothetical protein